MHMDSLKSLMERKEYDLVIKITNNSQNADELFYRISALLASGKYQDALDCLNTNRDILRKDLLLLMHVHIELLCILGRFDEAYQAVKYYEELPYESQKVEEYLKELPNLIRLEEKKKYTVNGLEEDELKKKLLSKDQEDVLMAIDSLRNRDINAYLYALEKVMTDFPKQSIRSFALLLLVQKMVNKDLKFKHIENIIDVNPSKLEPPFIGSDFNDFVKELSRDFKNPSLSENAIQILSSYLIYIYPQKVDLQNPALKIALYLIANEYLQSKDSKSLEVLCAENDTDIDEATILIARIRDALDNF